MPPPDAPPLTRIVVLRALGFGVAIALGAVAVWLIVIADSTKSVQLGVLAGIWGALLGAFSMFGARRHGLEPDDAPAPSRSEVPVLSAQEIAMRTTGEVERIAEAAARRAFEDRLEQMMRREISREVGDLRGEIARLRQDLLDKVGGQLRLERIETTRVIGSDLEALQHEVRQLKQASETGTLHELGLGTPPKRLVVESAKVRPVSRTAAEAAADVQPARAADQPAPPADAPVPGPVPAAPEPAVAATPPAAPAPAPAAAPLTPRRPTPEDPVSPAVSANGTSGHGAAANGASAPGANNGHPPNGASSNGAARRQTPRAAPAPAETTGPIRLQQPTDSPAPRSTPDAPAGKPQAPTPKPAETWSPPAPPTPAAAAPPQPPAAPVAATDPFAALPRITPFTEFELDPVDTTPARTRSEPQDARPAGPASPVAPAHSAYTGRRRRTDGSDTGADAGRHSRHDAPAPPPVAPAGRRRRADDETDDDDLLSRLLARGSADH